MNSSVKFLEPTVIAGVEAAPWAGWIAFELVPPDLDGFELVDLLLLEPHAASASAAPAASRATKAGRVLMRDIVLLVGGDFRPRGVTARCRPAKIASAASASAATRMAPPSRPAST